MDERSMRILEWDKIRHLVADRASFSLGKELALQLYPSTDATEVQNRLERTSHAVSLLWKYGDPPFGGAMDITPILQRSSIGGILDGTELLSIVAVLDCAGNMQRYLAKSEHFSDCLSQLHALPELAAEIKRCIDDDGSIRDNASPQLATIRQKIRTLENKIRDKLDSIVHSGSYQKLLQDSIVTIRNGRYVVPVKQEHRAAFGGIVHDQSASGATLFIEPAVVVELNNQLRIAQQDEEREIERILRHLSNQVTQTNHLIKGTLNTLARLDLIFAMAKFSRYIRGTVPKLNTHGFVHIKQGRHPLLTGNVVPIDIWIGDQFWVLVITGPNTGGKTVTLKTVGLFALMTQAGLHIPANDGSEMAVFDNIFADIGDEQSIEQSLSTFSSHMSNIVKIIDRATANSLVLLDELGAGTDPTEGAALATALLDYFRQQRITTIATTHYSELKNFAYANPEVENASVEFDPETLKPTYRLAIGVPGRSNAFAIAQGLGLPDAIVTAAKGLLSDEKIHVEDIISEIETDRREAQRARETAEAMRTEYEQLKLKYEYMHRELQEKKEALLAEARTQADELISRTRHELDLLIGELRKQQNLDLAAIVDAKRRELAEQQIKLRQHTEKSKPSAQPLRNLLPGEQVKVRSLNQTGYVLEISETEALVQIGIMKVTVKLTDLERVDERPKPVVHRTRSGGGLSKSVSIHPELDLRGNTIDDAIVAVDKYLDDAFLSSLAQVRIIHGKGTGALREAIQSHLRNHPHVKHFRLADPSQGGSGVTVVELNR